MGNWHLLCARRDPLSSSSVPSQSQSWTFMHSRLWYVPHLHIFQDYSNLPWDNLHVHGLQACSSSPLHWRPWALGLDHSTTQSVYHQSQVSPGLRLRAQYTFMTPCCPTLLNLFSSRFGEPWACRLWNGPGTALNCDFWLNSEGHKYQLSTRRANCPFESSWPQRSV